MRGLRVVLDQPYGSPTWGPICAMAAWGRLQPGWPLGNGCCPSLGLQVGVVQKTYLNALGCLWFNRTEVRVPFGRML